MNDVLRHLLQNPRVWRGSRPGALNDALNKKSPGSGKGSGTGSDKEPGNGALHESLREGAAAYPTGYASLDERLPGGGWPRHALTEILPEHYGTGELKLLMPALARLSHAEEDNSSADRPASGDDRETGWIAWISPPFQPYPPALLQWGVNLAHMLIVHPRKNTEALWAAEQALASGNCAAVLVWSEALDGRTSRRLQLAAERGQSWAVAFRPLRAAAQASAAALRMALVSGERGTEVRILKSRGGRPVTLSGVLDDKICDHAE